MESKEASRHGVENRRGTFSTRSLSETRNRKSIRGPDTRISERDIQLKSSARCKRHPCELARTSTMEFSSMGRGRLDLRPPAGIKPRVRQGAIEITTIGTRTSDVDVVDERSGMDFKLSFSPNCPCNNCGQRAAMISKPATGLVKRSPLTVCVQRSRTAGHLKVVLTRGCDREPRGPGGDA